MKRKVPLSPWCIECKVALLRKNMEVNELADALGINRVIVSSVINGRQNAPAIADKISEYLGVTEPYSVSVS